jgi:threonine dehydrogenase-like Zn-dependent dehydrogenase
MARMKAVTWHAARDIRVDEVDDPRIVDPTDAIVRITSTAICGSDLHLLDVFGPVMHRGDILGHEAMGVVEEVGPEVRHVSVGDRVIVPFVIACGVCRMCRAGLSTQCETTRNDDQGTGAKLYGYTELYGRVMGGQAEALRVLLADSNLRVVGRDLPDERYLFLTDVAPTAWQAVEYAGLEPGDTVAVIGLGPVGQMAARIARYRGHRVLGVDPVAERRLMAERYGVEVFDYADHAQAAGELAEATGGAGPDAVIDAVGTEAHGSPGVALMQNVVGSLPSGLAKPMLMKAGVDRLTALQLGIDAVRRGGTLSVVGVYGGNADPMPMMTIFDKQIAMRFGQANVQHWLPELLPLAEAPADPLGLEDLATHRVPLDRAPEMYEQFKDKSAGCIKVVLKL